MNSNRRDAPTEKPDASDLAEPLSFRERSFMKAMEHFIDATEDHSQEIRKLRAFLTYLGDEGVTINGMRPDEAIEWWNYDAWRAQRPSK